MKTILTYIAVALLLLCSCAQTPKDVTAIDVQPTIFPDYVNVTVPAGIAPLNFNVLSDHLECVDVTITGESEGSVHTSGKWAKFDVDAWHKLLDQNLGGKLTVSVQAKVSGKWFKYEDFNIYVSPYPLDEWGLTYRRIAPSYELFSSLGIYQRDLSNFDESVILDNSETAGVCLNCHTANKKDPAQFVFHVRGPHGATLIQKQGKREWLKATNDAIGGSMVYPYWHPSGKYCAFSTNQTNQGFHIGLDKRIEVFDYSSDVFVYNTETHEVLKDSLLSSKDWAENCPVFSPDGRKLYFISSPQADYPSHYKEARFNLCSIDFHPEEGTYGHQVDTLFNAAAMGKSLTWPRPSYDGRFLMFALIDYGYFSIWHKESDLWLMSTETGQVRPLVELNSDDTESYPNWNSNSHWVVFTSRRENGLYSQLFMASIEGDGMATKPFLLPQENPLEYYDETFYSFNTPDFTHEKVSFDAQAAQKEILSDVRVATSCADQP